MRKVYDAKEKPTKAEYYELLLVDGCPVISYWDGQEWNSQHQSIGIVCWREIEPWDADPARPRTSELEWQYGEEPPKDRRFIVEIDDGIRIAIWDSVVGEWSAEAIRKTDGGAWVTIHGIKRWADLPEWLKAEESKPGAEPVVVSPPEAQKPPPWLCPKCGKEMIRDLRKGASVYGCGCGNLAESPFEFDRREWRRLNAMRELARDIIAKGVSGFWRQWANAILGEEAKGG